MAFYVYESFAVFRKSTEEERGGIYARGLFFMFLVHLTSFLMMYFQTQNLQYLFFYAFQQLTLFAFYVLFVMLYPACNRLIIQNICMLLTVGFIILTRLNMNKAMRQFIIAVIALAISLFIPQVMAAWRFLSKLKFLYAAIGIASLGVVLILGSITNGSKLSYSIMGLSFQPSEFIKLIFVFFLAAALCTSTKWSDLVLVAALAAVHVLILVASKDLGSALIFFVITVLSLFLATRNPLFLLLGAIAGSGASVLAYQIFPHIQVRVQAWRDPWSVINGKGYQVSQSLFAIGRGGLFGLGLFGGASSKIPYVEQDFIFSAIAEEMGLIFACLVLFVCLSSFLMMMSVAMQVKNKFFRLITFGLGCLYIFQVFLTVGGNVKFIPLTGVTLPLVSYGGSSVLSTILLFAVIEGIYIRKDDIDEREKIGYETAGYAAERIPKKRKRKAQEREEYYED